MKIIIMEQQNIPIEAIFGRFRGWVGLILLFVITIGTLVLLMRINPKKLYTDNWDNYAMEA